MQRRVVKLGRLYNATPSQVSLHVHAHTGSDITIDVLILMCTKCTIKCIVLFFSKLIKSLPQYKRMAVVYIKGGANATIDVAV